jgi:transposase
VRVSTAFNRMLQIPGAWADEVSFTPREIVVRLRHKTRRLRCPCGYETRSRYDTRTRRWRHLDLGSCRLLLEAEIRRIDCQHCQRVRSEEVPWARPGARHTRDFEDIVTWLCQRTDKTTVSKLLRCSWRTVDAIVQRVVADHLDDKRLDDLYRIGVDEFSYRKGHHYMTLVACHDSGRVVWAGEGRGKSPFLRFFDELGKERTAKLTAISMDEDIGFQSAAADRAPQARVCFDPFHLVRWASRAVDAVRQRTTNELQREMTPVERRSLRWAILKNRDDLSPAQQRAIASLRKQRHVLFRAWELKESFRDLYRLDDPADARTYLKRWITRALRSRITAFVNLARRMRANFEGIVSAVELGISNALLEGTNAKIRNINRRGYGHRTATSLVAMTYLCCGGLKIQLPTERA